MPRVIRAVTRPPGPAPRAAGSENRLYVSYALRDKHGLQCGYCTPGILLTAHAFLRENPSPTRAEIREALAGRLCRCTGYHFIVEAIEAAVQRAGAGRLAPNPQEET